MSSTTGGGWAQLRQQARTLEQQTETLFQSYSQFGSVPSIPPKPTEEETRTESQLRELLEKREALIAQLSRLLDSEPSISAVKQNNLSRHREVLVEHRKSLTSLKSNLSAARDKANLLSNVRSDIETYRSNNPAEAEAEYMLDERRRIDNSHNMVDSVLSQAYATNEQFGLQREMLQNVNRRITGALQKVPGINTLMGRIGSKKRRDGIILGSFIAFCFLMLLWFW